MPTIHHRHCPVCGSQEFRLALTVRDHMVSGEAFTIYECDICSLRFTQDVPDPSSIEVYYQSADYISHAEDTKGLINWIYRVIRDRNIRKKRRLIQSLNQGRPGTVLDVGAGIGTFLAEMHSNGWEVTGIEPSGPARAIAAKKYNLKLEDPSQLYNLPARKFDVITLWHVLEHVHDLHGYLRQIRKLLKEKGQLLVAVPNYKSGDAAAYKEFWAAYDVPRHLYHFSPRSMEILLNRHELQIKEKKPMWFDSFYISLLSSRYRRGRTQFIPGFWNGMVSNLKAWRDVDNCSSLTYIASK